MILKSMAAGLTLTIALTGSALAAGDPAAGEVVFKKCAICHSAKAGEKKIGPSLFGVVGRKAGTVEGFKYSPANLASGLTWDEPTLDVYLTDPKAKVPGTLMSFPGLKDATERANAIAYLKTLK